MCPKRIFVTFILFSAISPSVILSTSLRNRIPPKISLQEIDTRTWKTTEVFSDSENDLDIILEEPKLVDKRLELNCRAPYPVVWIYNGDGVSTMQVTTGVNTVHGILSESREFTATGTIGFVKSPSESDTGNYTCHNLQDVQEFTSYYIYIAGEKLFVQTNEQTVFYTEGDTVLRIPCSVTHPDVKLSLQKMINGIAEFPPLNGSISYDPKFGFLLYVPDFPDVEGTYLCNAAFDGSNSTKINVIKYNAIFACTDGPCLNCSTKQCGENTSCKVFKGKPKCSCLPGFTGNPDYGCTDIRQVDDCRRVCGINSACDFNTNFKEIRCRCLPGFYGDPYHACHPNQETRFWSFH